MLVYGLPLAGAEERQAHVAGAFYPAEPAVLRQTITQWLAQASSTEHFSPRILISPHAGYDYSGPVAAWAFRQVQGRTYDGVVVVGLTHRDDFEGTSVDDRSSYVTPLGTIPVDLQAVEFLKTQPGLTHVERAHESQEHSLEVMLPFLQVALGNFKLVPLLMGRQAAVDAEALADALAKLSQRGNYLYLFSTDLSHYHPYDDARRRDQLTINIVLGETPEAAARLAQAGALEACGRGPILTSLWLAKRLGWLRPQLLRAANSGDITGEKDRVVGYAAIGFSDAASADVAGGISREAGQALVAAARLVLDMQLRPARYETRQVSLGLHEMPELAQARGMFVTLKKHGQLRGCIGRIDTDEPLATLLPTVTLDAALRDTRFAPLTAAELEEVTVEVSVLSHPSAVHSPADIVAGRDGVVLQKDAHNGVFLPQVWNETGWTRVEFLRELASKKAGLAPDAWQDAHLFTFQDHVFEEAH